jgi:hypothetical protein
VLYQILFALGFNAAGSEIAKRLTTGHLMNRRILLAVEVIDNGGYVFNPRGEFTEKFYGYFVS